MSASFQGVKRLFVLVYDETGDNNDEPGIKSNKNVFFQQQNVTIDEKFFIDQPINDLIKQYDEVRNV